MEICKFFLIVIIINISTISTKGNAEICGITKLASNRLSSFELKRIFWKCQNTIRKNKDQKIFIRGDIFYLTPFCCKEYQNLYKNKKLRFSEFYRLKNSQNLNSNIHIQIGK